MDIAKSNKTALVFGGTGLIGSYLLRHLCASEHYIKILSYGRRKASFDHPKLDHQIIDFSKLDSELENMNGHDIFICLGTTIRKAGSREAFKRIDKEYVLKIAEIAAEKKVNQLFLVSAVDANSSSKVFYSRVKGEVEIEAEKLNFWAIHIFRPSILLGSRDENRPLEKIAVILGGALNKISNSILGKYQPVHAERVAIKMVRSASALQGGVFYYASDEINAIE
ncbi:MAG: NAD-dependent epimerase/dehydratase family protein [Saprospirales bacterium]|nr:MAG: NAD-dependent epimerase/dehydratase family protein [Saprospirales bacterium]